MRDNVGFEESELSGIGYRHNKTRIINFINALFSCIGTEMVHINSIGMNPGIRNGPA